MDPSLIVPKDECVAIFKRLKQGANKNCIDCNAANPSWASIPFGAFICFTCAGRHRGLGTHITFVRSTEIDDWTNKQLMVMARGGNAKLKSYFRQNDLDSTADKLSRYSHRVAVRYRSKMGKLAETELRASTAFIPDSGRMDGDGAAESKEDFFAAASGDHTSGMGSLSDASSRSISPLSLPRPAPHAGGAETADLFSAGNVSLSAVAGAGGGDWGKRKPKKKGGLGTRVDDSAFSSMEESIAEKREQDRLAQENLLVMREKERIDESKANIFDQSHATKARTFDGTGNNRAKSSNSKQENSLASSFGGLGLGAPVTFSHSASDAIEVMSNIDEPKKSAKGRSGGGYSDYDNDRYDRYDPHCFREPSRGDTSNEESWGAPSRWGKSHGEEERWGDVSKSKSSSYRHDDHAGGDEGGWGATQTKSPTYATRSDNSRGGWGVVDDGSSAGDGWGAAPASKSTMRSTDRDARGASAGRQDESNGWSGGGAKSANDYGWGSSTSKSKQAVAGGDGDDGAGSGWGSQQRAHKSDRSTDAWGSGGTKSDDSWGKPAPKEKSRATSGDAAGGGWGHKSSAQYNNDRYTEGARSGRGAASSTNDDRLQNFASAKSLSSDQYFNRDPPPRRKQEDSGEILKEAATRFGQQLKSFYYKISDDFA